MNPVLESARKEFQDRLDGAFAEHLAQKVAGWNPSTWGVTNNLRLGMGVDTYAQQADYNKARQQAPAPKPAGGPTWGGTDVGAGIAAVKKQAPASAPASAPANPNNDPSVKTEL